MPVSETTQRVLTLLKSRRVISVLAAPANRLMDIRALILLSQMVYWTLKDIDSIKTQGWMLKSSGDWQDETRLTRNYLSRSIHLLTERGVIKAWHRSSRGSPWIKVNLDALYLLCRGKPAPQTISLEQFIHNQAYRERLIGKSMPYFTVLADMAGDALQGMFLSRCVYWQEMLERRNRLEEANTAWGWSSTDWTADLGLSRTQLRLAIQQAENLRLLTKTEINRPFAGISIDMLHLEATVKAIIVPPTSEENPTSIAGYEHLETPVHTVEPSTVEAGLVPEGTRTGEIAIIIHQVIPQSEHELIQRILLKAPGHRRQLLLDELAGRITSGAPVKNRVSLLRYLVQQDAKEPLVLEYAHRIEGGRKAAEEHARRLSTPTASNPSATSISSSISPKDKALRTAALFTSIGMTSSTRQPGAGA